MLPRKRSKQSSVANAHTTQNNINDTQDNVKSFFKTRWFENNPVTTIALFCSIIIVGFMLITEVFDSTVNFYCLFVFEYPL